MATNTGGRKRQQRSKGGLQNKVSNSDGQRNREQPNQTQRQQAGLNNNKSSQNHLVTENQKSQSQKQQQQQEHEQQNQQQLQQQQQDNKQQQQQQQQRHQLTPVNSHRDPSGSTGKTDSPTFSLLAKNRSKSVASQDKCQTEITEDQKMTLETAMYSRRYDVVENLLQVGAKSWSVDQMGSSVFLTACRLGDVRLMNTFWDACGSSLDLQYSNTDGDTALHVCAKSGCEDGCKLLLSHGASLHSSNKSGDTPLHIAAHGDHVSTCQTILNFIVSSSDGNVNLHHFVLAENNKRQTPVCLSILNSHAEVTKKLLECLPVKDLAEYLNRSFQRILSQPHFTSFTHTGSAIQETNGTFLHGLLVSMSVLLIRTAEKRRREKEQAMPSTSNNEAPLEFFLADSDTIQSLVRIACISNISEPILTISCFLVVFLMDNMSEREDACPSDSSHTKQCPGESLSTDVRKFGDMGRKFTEQFLQCCGPDCLLLKLNDLTVTDPNYAAVSMATVTPIMFLARSIPGRSWLEANKSHLTFLKELLLQNRSAFSLLTSTCPLLKLPVLESSSVEFIKLVEVLEDRDRETNLAELLWEEERDRMRRERKRHKRNQRKQHVSSQLKKEVALLPLQVSDVTSEEDLGQPYFDEQQTSGEAHMNIWKLEATFQEENDNFASKSNHTSGVEDNGVGDYVFPQHRYDQDLHEQADEKQISGNGQNVNLISKDFSPHLIPDSGKHKNFKLNLLAGEQRAWSGETPTKEIHECDDLKAKFSGCVSKEMRWADVAKSGQQSWSEYFNCNQEILENGGDSMFLNNVHEFNNQSFSSFHKLKMTSLDKPEEMNVGTVQVAAAGPDKIGNDWFDFMNHNQSIDSCSDDEDSSSSLSSTESCSSLVSDSLLLRPNRLAMTVDVAAAIDFKQRTTAFGKRPAKSTKLQLMNRWKKQRNMDSLHSSCEGKAPDTNRPIGFCDSSIPVGDRRNNSSFISGDQPCERKNKPALLMLPTVGGSVIRSRSDDILLDLSRTSVEDCKSNSKKEKNKAVPKKVRMMKGLLAEPISAKQGLPPVLPPLKLKEHIIGISNRKRSNDHKDITANMDVSVKGTHSDRVLPAKSVPIIGGMRDLRPDSKECRVTETELNYVNSHPNWLQPPKLITTPSLQMLSSSSPTLGQDMTRTHAHIQPQNSLSLVPPFMKQMTSVCAEFEHNITSRLAVNSHNENSNTVTTDGGRFGQRVEQQATHKSRVITTVLLDNVQNPPQAFQCNKVPPLSTLALNSGVDLAQSWSKTLPSSKNKLSANTAFQIERESNEEEQRTTSGEIRLISQVANETVDSFSGSQSLELKQIIENNASKLSKTHVSTGFDAGEYNLHDGSTFSSLLMNRILQRSQTRNPPCIVDMPLLKNYSKADEGPKTSSQFHVNNLPIPTGQTYQSIDSEKYAYMFSKGHIRHDQQPSAESQICNQDQFQKTIEHESNVCVQSLQNDNSLLNKNQGAVFPAKKTCEKLEFEENLKKESQLSKPCDVECPPRQVASPPVLFPEKIRDNVHPSNVCGDTTFPSFHDVETSDFLSEMFSDPLFSDKIAINQIRQKILSNHASQGLHPGVSPSLSNDIDLDYYASLYRMKFRDVLSGPPTRSQCTLRPSKDFSFISGHKINVACKEGQIGQNKSQSLEESLIGDSRHLWQPSARWCPILQKILDLRWTTRRQYEDIVLPEFLPEFSIGMAGDALINLGYLMDGTEVAVFLLYKRCQYMTPRMIEIISDPEMEKHFLSRCRSYSESSDVQYIAMSLFEYTLCEYLQICLSDCSAKIATYNGLVWQMLQAVTYLHHGLGIPHGRLAPDWVFINAQGNVRLAGFGIESSAAKADGRYRDANQMKAQVSDPKPSCWMNCEDVTLEQVKYNNFAVDVRAAGMLAYYILTRGQYQFGTNPLESDIGSLQDRVSLEAFDLICPMLAADPKVRPTVDQCLKHPMFWSEDKKFRLILIVGSDVLTEMKTGVALTGTGAPTMMEILSMVDISIVSPNWIHEVDGTVLKEMRSFRVYKNNLAELTLFVYNCCLHFDKLSNVAKEILDDPSKYFQNLFPSLFLAIYRSLKGSDRSERTCYKPFF